MNTLTMDLLRRGEQAGVVRVDLANPSAKRLADLGFVPGAIVQMLRPGRPCIVRLSNSRLGLSDCLQKSVMLRRSGD